MAINSSINKIIPISLAKSGILWFGKEIILLMMPKMCPTQTVYTHTTTIVHFINSHTLLANVSTDQGKFFKFNEWISMCFINPMLSILITFVSWREFLI